MITTRSFVSFLESGDISGLRSVPKSDLHNHGIYGGNQDYIRRKTGAHLKLESSLNGLTGMAGWCDTHLKPLYRDVEGLLLLFESAFIQAAEDGVTRLEMSLDSKYAGFFGGNCQGYVDAIRKLHQEFAPQIDFRPEIGINRCLPTAELYPAVKKFIDTGYFKSIDLYGDEFARLVENFKEIYRMAGEKGLKLKAHVGEAGTAEDIVRAVEVLNLTEIQHGIAAATSEKVMDFLAERSVQLNICPESNITLGYSSDYTTPARILFDNGVRITINTDDCLIFGKGLSEQYLKLYQSGTFSAADLDSIRLNGLNSRQ
ncbi:MAG: adenosine deaminase [Candidatus Wallbacteria bacterium]|nr:adenosine deaminase [Candidatus Wallbacteria bacterium]